MGKVSSSSKNFRCDLLLANDLAHFICDPILHMTLHLTIFCHLKIVEGQISISSIYASRGPQKGEFGKKCFHCVKIGIWITF